MNFKKRTAAIIACTLVCVLEINAFAGVLGEVISNFNMGIGTETGFYHNVYQDGEKFQREYYVEYKPNPDIVPVVVNGDSIYGKRTILQAVEYMKKNGMKPLIGINADYFSFKTGIPMGHTIIDGELVTNDSTGQNAVGFNADGTAFISWLQVVSTMTSESGESMILDCINKWCQPTISASYLHTDKFGSSTKTSGSCKFIIFSPVGGKLAIENSITLRVDEKFDYDGEIAIPKGKLVLAMTNTYGEAAKLAFMDSLEVGETVTLKNESVYDKQRWGAARHGMGSIGGRLIEGGRVNSEFEAGTAPRTAVGVKADGTVVFYVIDGRQPEFSVGVKIKDLAKRMAELGCVDAINLDGGGSTAIAGIFPGSDEYSVVNQPSEGSPRSCANYIFLRHAMASDNAPAPVPPAEIIPPSIPANTFEFENMTENRNFLSGCTETITPGKVADMSGNVVAAADITYAAENHEDTNITVSGNVATAAGSGTGYVVASGSDVFRYITYSIYETPEKIQLSSNGAEIKELFIGTGTEFSADLDAAAFVNGIELNSIDSCYSWGCDGEIGFIEANGMFVADTSKPAEGSVYVSAGELTYEIPVVISEKRITFTDMNGHWAEEYAQALYKDKIITGEETANGLVYRPDSMITRGEFAVIISRYLHLKTDAYPDAAFADFGSIPAWQRPFVNAVYAAGVINGKETEYGIVFDGEARLTRAEAIAILGRIYGAKDEGATLSFADSGDIPSYAKGSVSKLVEMGIINGYEDGTLRPGGNITRGECAKMIHKAY